MYKYNDKKHIYDEFVYSDKVILPTSVINMIDPVEKITVEITSVDYGKVTYCGVNFSSSIYDQDIIIIPNWIMFNLGLCSGDRVNIRQVLLKNVSFIKISSFTSDFYKLSDPKTVLEYFLGNFMCLYINQVFRIKHCGIEFLIKVEDMGPVKVGIINNCDVNVEIIENDFDE